MIKLYLTDFFVINSGFLPASSDSLALCLSTFLEAITFDLNTNFVSRSFFYSLNFSFQKN